MHHAILERLGNGPARPRLLRFTSGRGASVLGAFPPGAGHAAWIAKCAYSPRAGDALRREARALEALAPWAGQLGIPRLLSFDGAGAIACLIQTGAPGQPLHFHYDCENPAPPPTLHLAIDWLRRFQGAVRVAESPPSRRDVFQELARALLASASADAVTEQLSGMLEQSGEPDRAAVPVHGDFWHFNLLARGTSLSVIDWEGFTHGLPLHDLFYLHANITFHRRGRFLDFDSACYEAFFSRSPLTARLRHVADTWGIGADALAAHFYAFAANMMIDRERPRLQGRLLPFLASHGYPPPGTALPAPDWPAG